MHAPSNWSLKETRAGTDRRTQFIQFAAQFIEKAVEPPGSGAIGGSHLLCGAIGLDDEIDGSILHVKTAAIGEHGDMVTSFSHGRSLPGAD